MLYDPKKWPMKDTPAPPTLLADVFNAAADVIQERGHCLGFTENSKGAMCLIGAINHVMNGSHSHWSGDSIDTLMLLRPFVGNQDPITWNNASTRTKAQVVSMLRRAAKSWTS